MMFRAFVSYYSWDIYPFSLLIKRSSFATRIIKLHRSVTTLCE
jgi:hypothetical protein